MPWSLQLLPDLPLIEINYTGVLTAQELVASFREALALSLSSGRHQMLTDCSTLTGGHTVMDLYGLAELLSATPGSHHLKEAVIMPPASEDEFIKTVGFWETVTLNRGFNVRLFRDRPTALVWLLAP